MEICCIFVTQLNVMSKITTIYFKITAPYGMSIGNDSANSLRTFDCTLRGAAFKITCYESQ
jgi:hypothetical protein